MIDVVGVLPEPSTPPRPGPEPDCRIRGRQPAEILLKSATDPDRGQGRPGSGRPRDGRAPDRLASARNAEPAARLTEERRHGAPSPAPSAGPGAWLRPLAALLARPGRGLAPDDRTSWSRPRRPRPPQGSAEHAEACRVTHRHRLARPRAARLVRALPDPGQADRGRGRRRDLVRLRRRRVSDQTIERRGPARPDPRLVPAPRGHAHGLRRLLRRPDAPLGRRGGLAPERGPPRDRPARPDRRRACSPAAASMPARHACSASRSTPPT